MHDVIKEFDIDYVQCALHKGELYMTDMCKESHTRRRVLKFSNIKYPRLIKALNKGFQAPLFIETENARRVQPDEEFYRMNVISMEYDVLVNRKSYSFFKKHPYLDIDEEKKWYSMEFAEVTGVRITKDENCGEEKEFDTTEEEKDFSVSTRITFKTDYGEEKHIYVDYFSYHITPISIDKYRTIIFLEQDDFLKSLMVRYNYHQDSHINKLELSKENLVFVKPYYKNLKKDKLRGVAQSLQDHFYGEEYMVNVLPIPVIPNYEVEGHRFSLKFLNVKGAKR